MTNGKSNTKNSAKANENILSGNADIFAILISTFLILVLIFIPSVNSSIFRLFFGALLVIFNPGYAFIVAFFPKKDELTGFERITLAFGLSIAIVPLTALALGYTAGLSLESMLGILTLFILVCSVIGIIRRNNLIPEARFAVDWSFFDLKLLQGEQGSRDKIISVLVAISLTVSLAVVAYAVITPAPGDRFTELYILNSNGSAGGFPKQISLTNGTNLTVGIANHEGLTVTYNLTVTQNVSSQARTLYSQQYTISDGSQLEKTIKLKPVATGNNTELNFQLFKGGNATPYRETHLFLNVTN